MDRQEHWENIYKTKKLTEVSWYEPIPETSLEFIKGMNLAKNAAIIDVGGGDSFLADFLLMEGYTNVSVLDISEEALNRVKKRLGERAEEIHWIVEDVTKFQPEQKYDLWHDRAAFHFLTEEDQVQQYLDILKNAVIPGGLVVIATFSEKGPTKCSGIEIKQYSINGLAELLSEDFEMVSCKNVSHETPSGAAQDFIFCSFRRK